MQNPFLLKPIPTDRPFCDRVEILEKVQDHARGGADIVLSSPRRYGKTSLVKRALNHLEKEGFMTIYVTFERLDSAKDAASRIARGIYESIGRRESTIEKSFRWAKNALTSFTPGAQLGTDGTPTLTVVQKTGIEGVELLEQVMKDLQTIADKLDNGIVIVFDEFQEITRLTGKSGIEGILRTHIQFQNFSHIFVGSRRSILLEMFSSAKRPFFNSAIMEILAPLPQADLILYYAKLFGSAGKECPEEVSAAMAELSKGYGFYAQQLGYFMFGLVDHVATMNDVATAYSIVLEQGAQGFSGILANMVTNQIRLLKALAKESSKELMAGEYLTRHDLVASNVGYAKKKLIEQDHIEQNANGWWKIVDPVFADWLCS